MTILLSKNFVSLVYFAIAMLEVAGWLALANNSLVPVMHVILVISKKVFICFTLQKLKLSTHVLQHMCGANALSGRLVVHQNMDIDVGGKTVILRS